MNQNPVRKQFSFLCGLRTEKERKTTFLVNWCEWLCTQFRIDRSRGQWYKCEHRNWAQGKLSFIQFVAINQLWLGSVLCWYPTRKLVYLDLSSVKILVPNAVYHWPILISLTLFITTNLSTQSWISDFLHVSGSGDQTVWQQMVFSRLFSKAYLFG